MGRQHQRAVPGGCGDRLHEWFHPSNSNIVGDQVTPLADTPDGHIWFTNFNSFGIEASLMWFDGSEFGSITVDEGLPHAQIADAEVREIPGGYELWLACTSRGLAVLTVTTDPPVPGDVDGDGLVGPTDLLALLAAWAAAATAPVRRTSMVTASSDRTTSSCCSQAGADRSPIAAITGPVTKRLDAPNSIGTVPRRIGPTTPVEVVLREDANPPAELCMSLAARSEAFRRTWLRDREDLRDTSASAHDLSLATIACLAGWRDQDVADLLVASRRSSEGHAGKALRRDYVVRTLSKAREAASPHAGDVDIDAVVERLVPKRARDRCRSPSCSRTIPSSASR